MKRLVAMVMAAGAALMAVAMPTKAELQKAQEMVTDVTAADVAALKAKTKTPTEVAAKHIDLATQAGSEAEKYLLLQGAFRLYAKAGDYEGAANALGTMNREIAGMNPEVIVEIYNKAIFSSMKEKAPRLHAIKEAARRQVFYRKQLAKAEAAVKTNPKDAAAQKKLGECHAELGDWPKALDAFALAGGSLAKTAKAELDGSAAPPVSGDFWWDYESGDEMSTYKFHAAELYRAALADDSFKGLARIRADQRVKDAEESEAIFCVKSSSNEASGGTLVVPSVSYKGGEMIALTLNGNGKKNVSFEFSACPPGEFVMGSEILPMGKNLKAKEWWNTKHSVKITYPFLIMQGPLSYSEADALDLETAKKGHAKFSPGTEHIIADSPVMELSWDDIQVLLAKMNEKMRLPPRLRRFAGYEFRLPTEAEWRYAMRGGSDAKDWGAFSDWCKEWAGYWWGKLPKGSHFPFAPVSSMKKTRNPWGLYYLGPKTIYADTFPGEYAKGAHDRTRDLCFVGQDIFKYAEKEVNPVRIFNGDDFSYLVFYAGRAQKLSPRNRDVQNAITPIRFVFAPKLSLLNVYPREEAAKEAKVKGGSSIASAKATTSSTSFLAPAPKSIANRTFDLGCERKLEMIACQAGEFTMGEKTVAGDCNEVRKHQVKITRPFWLSKVAVTRSQWKMLLYGAVVGEKEDGQYDFAAVNSRRGRKEQFMAVLNRVCASELPKGYVFRLPTEAELAYAMTSGGRDKVTESSIRKHGPSSNDKANIIQELNEKGVKLVRAGVDRATKVGVSKPNTWGFYDVINNGHPEVLDMIAPNSRMRKMKRDAKGNYLNISYEDIETDPLCWDEGEKDVAPLHCDQTKFWVRCTLGDWGWNDVFRVCLGPDLVAEKKAKK